MKLIHVNPVTGDTGVCRAAKSQCPFGVHNHFDSEVEARQSFEIRQLAPKTITRISAPITVESILDIDLLKNMVTQGYIMQSSHPDDQDLKILCYGKRTQSEGKWNEATKIARGLIIRTTSDDYSDAIIVQRPWSKFFTLQQLNGAWHLGDEENVSSAEDSFGSLDFNAPAEVYDKLDGSLGILYRDPSGKPALSTKGAFISDQAVMFTKILRENSLMAKEAENILNEGSTTAMFELVGPDNRIVLAYKKNDVILIGGVDKASGANILPEKIGNWSATGLSTVERMKANSLEEALSAPPRTDHEGVVVSVGGINPMKIKIKQEDYSKLHRIVTMFSKRESRNLVAEMPASYADLLALARDEDIEIFAPIKNVLNIEGFKKGADSYEFIRSRRERYFKSILMPRAHAIAKAKAYIDDLDESWFTGEKPLKRFSASTNTLEFEKVSLFILFKARLDGTPLEEASAFQELRRAVKDVKNQDD